MSITASRRLLLTGGMGFLGKILSRSLREQGYEVSTLGKSDTNDIVCELSSNVPELSKPPGLVVHAAGKAHVVSRTTKEFFNVNVAGTVNLLRGLEQSSPLPDAVVFVSSVSVYGLIKGENINEDHPLSSDDAYGISKMQAENLLTSWCEKNKVTLSILRLPLLAGPNPPGNLGAMITGIRKGYYLNIAGGKARKSMVMASDVAAVIPKAAANPGIYHLTDGHHPSFWELGECIAAQLGVKPPRNISLPVAKVLGFGGDVMNIVLRGKAPISSVTIAKLTSTLTFDDTKARKNLGWNPSRVIDAFRLH